MVCSSLELAQALPLNTLPSRKINCPGSEQPQNVQDGELSIFWVGPSWKPSMVCASPAVQVGICDPNYTWETYYHLWFLLLLSLLMLEVHVDVHGLCHL